MTILSKIPAVLGASVFLMVLPACVNLKPVPSQTFKYTLGPVGAASGPEALSSGEPIYILRPQVPTYLDDARLSYRTESGEVKSLFGARWAEPLAEGIARAMSLYLSESSQIFVEGYYPWPNTSPDTARLMLNFQRFGATDSGKAQVAVRWEFKQSDGDAMRGQYVSNSLGWTVGEPDTLVAAYNEALRALASQIEDSIENRSRGK